MATENSNPINAEEMMTGGRLHATPDDLIVEIRDDLGFVEFHGSRAMLEAEGIIPKGTDWPQGYDDLRWQAGKFNYWLRRQRPPGAKGTRRDFANVDWFFLRSEPTHQPSLAQREIARKTQELKDTIYRRSPKGEAEWSAQWNRYWQSTKDAAFQAFKATIPGLVQRKRGRPCKSQEQG